MTRRPRGSVGAALSLIDPGFRLTILGFLLQYPHRRLVYVNDHVPRPRYVAYLPVRQEARVGEKGDAVAVAGPSGVIVAGKIGENIVIVKEPEQLYRIEHAKARRLGMKRIMGKHDDRRCCRDEREHLFEPQLGGHEDLDLFLVVV